MKTIRSIVLMSIGLVAITGGSSCKLWNSVFGPKYGCPANSKNAGAERILSGEKLPKAKKFRS